MRSMVRKLAAGSAVGLAWSAGLAGACPTPAPGDGLFPASYQVEATTPPTLPTPDSTLPGASRGWASPAILAPAPAPAPTTGQSLVAPSPRPRLAPAISARVGRERLEAFPRAARAGGGTAPATPAPATPAPAPPPPSATVAAMLSTGPRSGASVPDYVPPSGRGALTRLVRGSEPDVPPGLPRGATRREMVPPEPLGAGHRLVDPAATAAALAQARTGVDPLLAPRVARAEPARSTEPTRGELTARHAVDPLLAPHEMPPARSVDRDRVAEMLAQVPPRGEDPLLAPKPLVMDRRSATLAQAPTPGLHPLASRSPQVRLDPFTPVLPELVGDDSNPTPAAVAAASIPDPASAPVPSRAEAGSPPRLLDLTPPPLLARPGLARDDQPLRRTGTTPEDH